MIGSPADHILEVAQFVVEFLVLFGVGDIAAGGNVEIMDGEARGLAGLLAQRDADMAAIALVGEIMRLGTGEGQARENGNAVIALLAVHGDVLVSELAEIGERETVIRAFGFLQAENIRALLGQEFLHEAGPEPDRIDVPCCNGQGHARYLGQMSVSSGLERSGRGYKGGIAAVNGSLLCRAFRGRRRGADLARHQG